MNISHKGDIVISENTGNELEAIKGYWTEERMENAKPVACPQIAHSDLVSTQQGEPKSDLTKPKDADTSKKPFLYGGKYFFSDYYGNDFCGSAQLCGHTRLILTAGHCVIDASKKDPEFHRNCMFARIHPNKKVEINPVGIRCIRVEYLKGNIGFDYAFGILQYSSGVTEFPSPVYVRGLQVGDEVIATGYPDNYGKGNKMQQTQGKIIYKTDLPTIGGAVIQMDNNPMGGGCSGGAWYRPNNNSIVGINTFAYGPEAETTLWGPYFGKEFDELNEIMWRMLG